MIKKIKETPHFLDMKIISWNINKEGVSNLPLCKNTAENIFMLYLSMFIQEVVFSICTT